MVSAKEGLSPLGRHISARIGRAIGDYNLIEEGDRILVAVSGGKDSLTLLKMLRERQAWAPVKYEIFAAHIKTDFICGACTHIDLLEKFFKEIDVRGVFREIKVLDDKKKTNCFWCSWNRRKALFEIADELDCNKVAMGHHKDDIIETILMNVLFQGEISTMNPRQDLFAGKLALVRPLCYVEEEMTKKYARENGFPSQMCRCPFGQDSQRKKMKDLIRDIQKSVPGMNIKTNIFNSVARIKEEYLGLKQDNG